MTDISTEELFSSPDIFKNRELLHVGHVPELTRVVGRDEEIQTVGGRVAPATKGGPPDSIIVYGKTGTGKSLVCQCVARETVKTAVENGVSTKQTYINCSEFDTEARCSREMARDVASKVDSTISVPSAGISASDYREIVWESLDTAGVSSYIIILDEIDKLTNDDILLSLSRAEESGWCDTHIGIICISNDITYSDSMSERVKSSFNPAETVFDPYDANQIRSILQKRRDAFYEDAVDETVLKKAAALSAREHGDARKAVDTLYEAGRLAEQQNDQQVTVKHLDTAVEQAEANKVQELIDGHPGEVKLILDALLKLSESNKQNSFRTQRIYDMYESLSTDPLSYTRMSELLSEQVFLDILESKRVSEGRHGAYTQYSFKKDTQIVSNALESA